MSNGVFRFSAVALKDLENILGDATESVASQLEIISCDYLAGAPGPEPESLSQDIARLVSALEMLVERVGGVSRTTKVRLGRPHTLGDVQVGGSPWQSLVAVRRGAADVIRRLKSVTPRRKPGFPRKERREFFAAAVAVVLRCNNLRVTTSRVGVFGKVLSIVLFETDGQSAPVEIFNLIKKASDFVRNMTDEQIHRWAQMASGHMRRTWAR